MTWANSLTSSKDPTLDIFMLSNKSKTLFNEIVCLQIGVPLIIQDLGLNPNEANETFKARVLADAFDFYAIGASFRVPIRHTNLEHLHDSLSQDSIFWKLDWSNAIHLGINDSVARGFYNPQNSVFIPIQAKSYERLTNTNFYYFPTEPQLISSSQLSDPAIDLFYQGN